MTEEGADALVAWTRAAVRAGIGMEAGSRLLFLKDPLLESMPIEVDAHFGAAWYCDWPEAEWLSEVESIQVTRSSLVASFMGGKIQFRLPVTEGGVDFFTLKQIAIRTHDEELVAVVAVSQNDQGDGSEGMPDGFPELVFNA